MDVLMLLVRWMSTVELIWYKLNCGKCRDCTSRQIQRVDKESEERIKSCYVYSIQGRILFIHSLHSKISRSFTEKKTTCFFTLESPRLTFMWRGCCSLRLWHQLTELAHPFSFCSCVYTCSYGPFNCISFHKFSRRMFSFSLCSSCLISVLLVLLTIYLFVKIALSPDVILCSWLALMHRVTNQLTNFKLSIGYLVTRASTCISTSKKEADNSQLSKASKWKI